MNPHSEKVLFFQAKDSQDQIWQAMNNEFRRAVKDKKHPFRLAVLGSQKSEGIGLRYIVLRAYTEEDRMLFYTDLRSPKVRELQKASSSSLLFYHPQKGLQIRIEGKMNVHHADNLCAEHWQRVQGIVQRAYTPLLAPGEIIEGPEQAHQWPEEMTSEYFCVLEFVPKAFDLLQLNRLEHLRLAFQQEGGIWKMNWLAP